MKKSLVRRIGSISLTVVSGLFLASLSGTANADLSSVLQKVEQNAPALAASRAQADAGQAALISVWMYIF